MPPPTMEELAPWALRPTIRAEVLHPTSVAEIPPLLAPNAGSLLTTGAMCSYGDACVNPGGRHLSTRGLNGIVQFDATTGLLVCGGGTTLRAVLEFVVPQGWFFPVVPGTMMTSVGGAIACDVHGKSHHVHGSFSHELLSFDLITADGQTRLCSRQQNDDLFWATVGGLGQTGIIVQATLPAGAGPIRVRGRTTCAHAQPRRDHAPVHHDGRRLLGVLDRLARARP